MTVARASLPGLAAWLALGLASSASASDWPRFRGPNGSGISPDAAALPSRLDPARNPAWSRELPPGISSPVIAGGRIYLTGLREKDLVTIALDRAMSDSIDAVKQLRLRSLVPFGNGGSAEPAVASLGSASISGDRA